MNIDLKPVGDAALQLLLKHVRTVLTVLAFAVLALVATVKIHGLQSQVTLAQNQAALASKTVEEDKGVFERQVQADKSALQSMLKGSDQQLQELRGLLKQKSEQLDNATTVSVQLRKALQAQTTAVQTQQQPPAAGGGPSATSRVRVDFDHDFGWLRVTGYTLTDPAYGFLTINNGSRPLKLTVALSKDRQNAWHAYVTSSDVAISADVLIAAVDPSIRDVKWYERLGVMGNVGVGDGLLVGAGLTLDIGRFTVGPAVWLSVNSQVSKYYGIAAVWRPFAR
jgi:hypothetical protein